MLKLQFGGRLIAPLPRPTLRLETREAETGRRGWRRGAEKVRKDD